MAGSERPPITAESLRRREEWQLYPESTVVWEEYADEGDGIGFDNLDPSACARALARTGGNWADIVTWHSAHLEAMGWQGRDVAPYSWRRWTHPAREGEEISVLDRSDPTIPSIVARVPGTTLYELDFKARGDATTSGAPDA